MDSKPVIKIALCGLAYVGKYTLIKAIQQYDMTARIDRHSDIPIIVSLTKDLPTHRIQLMTIHGVFIPWGKYLSMLLKNVNHILYVLETPPDRQESQQQWVTMYRDCLLTMDAYRIPWTWVINKVDIEPDIRFCREIMNNVNPGDLRVCCARDGRGVSHLWETILRKYG